MGEVRSASWEDVKLDTEADEGKDPKPKGE